MSPRDAEELTELKVWHDLVTLGRSSSGVGELVRPGSVLGLPAAALLCGRAAEAAEALAGPAAVRS